MVVDGRAPDPREARSAPEFIALLRMLKDASGLTFRELSQRADAVGDVLPRSTIANMLGRTSVPREELLAAFVRACGCGPAQVADWLAVRKELAVHGERAGTAEASGAAPEETAGHSSEPPTVPLPEPAPAGRRRTGTLVAAVVALVVLAAAAVTVTLLVRGDDDPPQSRPVTGPVAGRTVQIRSVHSGLCLSEKRDSDSGELYQVPCEQETIPRFSLKPLTGDAWRIVTDHPVHLKGCTGVWNGVRDAEAPLQDQECGKRGDAEEFLIEPVGRPVDGYRVRPAHTRLCVGAERKSKERGAELVQTSCDGADRGNLFSFDPVAAETAGG
ncbi:helix-turn-helix domain-containing protein [Streptomyces sp. NBC_00893]|uniref:helix-turn-helix domain-containing protein n=1 Tax=Streptomyces sp. NBC_00893 TaxID=2975862 RepID=UPI00225B2959|nr:helix-turn-helix domain-containing protein [Streptomyces sp. NBC_00893]MCX4845147.1 helix-turn-helix domain-containing protein [Streptomyces sp. NBC_00893]